MRVVIFTEGGGTYGFGHLTRCQALYQALAEQGVDVTMIMRGEPEAVYLLRGCRVACFDWIADAKRLNKSLRGVDCAIVDSYHADGACCERIATMVRRAVFLDDTQRIPYPHGIVLNAGPGATAALYPDHEGGVLAGPSYALLRRAFWDARPAPARDSVADVLVIMGGTDFRGMTGMVAETLCATLPASTSIHIAGAAPSDSSGLSGKAPFIIHERLGEPELLSLMSSVDIAVCAGGQTLNELARLGVPAVALRVADNQDAGVAGFAAAGCVRDAGRWDDPNVRGAIAARVREVFPPAIRRSMRQAGPALIDGQGARRASARILEGLHV